MSAAGQPLDPSGAEASRIARELGDLARLAGNAAGEVSLIRRIAERYRTSLASGGTLFFAGNGGSAADAQHLATEYVVRYAVTRQPMRAVALTTDTSLLTAASNDLGFDQVFARQVEALGRPGDVLILHSTSGNSPNLLAAAEAARARALAVVAFLGRDGGALRDRADLAFVVPSEESSRIQEVHLAVQHVIAGLLERDWAARGGSS